MAGAWEIPGFSFSLQANIDMSQNEAVYGANEPIYQYTGVQAVAGTGVGVSEVQACAPVSATGNAIVGILQNNPMLAEAATIVNTGISKALLQGAVSIGGLLMATIAGTEFGFVVATSGKFAVAMALDNGVAGDIIPVLLGNWGKQ